MPPAYPVGPAPTPGQLHAVREARRQIKQRLATLTQALDAIDVEVDDTTRELASNLLDQAAHHRRQPPAARS